MMEFHYEAKKGQANMEHLLLQAESTSTQDMENRTSETSALRELIHAKEHQEQEALQEIIQHNGSDCFIRRFVKKLSDHFREVEKQYRGSIDFLKWSAGWRSLHDHAYRTLQDDMSNVDLPNFVELASADITKWRFDVTAHVSPAINDAIVFSHQQGPGSKMRL